MTVAAKPRDTRERKTRDELTKRAGEGKRRDAREGAARDEREGATREVREDKMREAHAEKARGGRLDGRRARQLRSVEITPNYLRHAEGSALIAFGATRVLCAASVQEGVPPWLRNSGRGWVTAEYGMLPRSTHTRSDREAARGKVGGRTQEIQRLIGRSLRAVIDMTLLGERTIWIDCDVIEADGGTRTASITGAYVALALAVQRLQKAGLLTASPLLDHVAAVSVGIVDKKLCLDLAYEEDSKAEVDMNVVMTGKGKFIEVQGTAEGKPFTATQLEAMTALATEGIATLVGVQKKVLAETLGGG